MPNLKLKPKNYDFIIYIIFLNI